MSIEEKSALRKRLRAEQSACSASSLEYYSQQIVKRVEQHAAFQRARVAMLFYPLPDEPRILPLLEGYRRSKTILLPVVQGTDIVTRIYQGAETLRQGAYGIMEPQGVEFTDYASIDFILIPGQAFSTSGARLGRGAGYYDRFLSNPSLHAFKLGVCFPFRITENIPIAPHDIPVDEVLII